MESKKTIRILFIENFIDDLNVVRKELKKTKLNFVSYCVENKSDFRIALEKFVPEIIISQYPLPTFDGYEAAEIVQEIAPQIPLIMFTDSKHEENAIEFMKAGAWGYVLKNQISQLTISVSEALQKRDTAESKAQTENYHIKSENMYKAFFENANSGLILIDSDNLRIVDANPAAYNLFDWLDEEFNSQPINQAYKMDMDNYNKMIRHTIEKKKIHFIFKNRKADKSYRDVQVYCGELKINGKNFLYSINNDITEQNLIKEELDKNEEKYRNLFEINQAGIYQSSTKGKILDCNLRFAKLLGYDSIKEILDVPAQQLYFSEADRNDFLTNLNKNGHLENYEVPLKKKDGNKIDLIHCTILINGVEGEDDKIQGTVIDITERKNTEEKLIKAKESALEADRLKTAFLANMSHEIRTPMNGMIGFSELLMEEGYSQEERSQFVEIIKNCRNQLCSLIDDIIDISKIETNQLIIEKNEFCISEVLYNIHSIFKIKAEKSELDFDLSVGLPLADCYIRGDERRIIQVLNNLLSNAFKFTSHGFINFGFKLRNNFLEFYISDSGIGISQEMQHIIFERYRQAEADTTRKYGGTGLGLAISKALVQLMGGKIWLESEPKKGSVFHFTIPYEPVVKEIAKIVNVEKPLESKSVHINKTILIAEDEELNFLLMKEILTRYKFKVIHAWNGKEVIDIMNEPNNVSLILMDLKMPVLDGYEATKEIKKNNKNIPIIAQTAYAQHEDQFLAFKAGCDGFVPKPIKVEKLINLITDSLEKFGL